MSRGHDRERLVRELLELGFEPYQRVGDELHGYVVARAAGSLGDEDLMAARALRGPGLVLVDLLLVEVKSDAIKYGPYNNFGPVRRERLRFAARLAGARAYLVWVPPTPPGMKGVHGCWIPESEWPT